MVEALILTALGSVSAIGVTILTVTIRVHRGGKGFYQDLKRGNF